MEILQIKNLSFKYPNCNENALNNIDLDIEKGSFNVIFGKSGCGKTTLLKLLKKEISPFGSLSGEILYEQKNINGTDKRNSVSEIGFVGQIPDEQIVTDKVWKEMAFGLENLGLESDAIRRRIGDTASYFGIQSWYQKSTDELSGGQKQILNLASVMAMQPKMLLLDEPTAQLDPVAAENFINVLVKLNRELGVTVIIAEHRLEELFSIADKAAAMDNGRVILCGSPREVCSKISDNDLCESFPSAVRIWKEIGLKTSCPLTVREGKAFLEDNFSSKAGAEIPVSEYIPKETVFEAEGVWFRYEKNLPDVLKDFSISVCKGEIYSILGGNGSGKTTALNVLSGLDKPYKGKSRIFGKKMSSYKKGSLYHGTLALLPQNPKTVFLKNTVREDFHDILKALNVPENQAAEKIAQYANEFAIENLLDKHPYDLSGGEQQKSAIVKLLLTEPKILLLDEPTKGMDAHSKNKFAKLLKKLSEMDKTIILVTHDIEFAAFVSDRCGLLFDGQIISEGIPDSFFSDNSFYTTAASRMSRGIFKNTVLCREVCELCKRKD
ncbi:MAG: ABC transporter ATP-binding protein [Oscillospiraceae bacterium]